MNLAIFFGIIIGSLLFRRFAYSREDRQPEDYRMVLGVAIVIGLIVSLAFP